MGLIKCALYALAVGFASFLLGRILPDWLFNEDHFPFKAYGWEDGGNLYKRLLHINKWQAKVPDMSKILPGLIPPKKVTGSFSQDLPGMIRETCIAEWIHGLLCFFAIPMPFLWPGFGGILFATAYILLGNLPFILIQRYNRPRLIRLRDKRKR